MISSGRIIRVFLNLLCRCRFCPANVRNQHAATRHCSAFAGIDEIYHAVTDYGSEYFQIAKIPARQVLHYGVSNAAESYFNGVKVWRSLPSFTSFFKRIRPDVPPIYRFSRLKPWAWRLLFSQLEIHDAAYFVLRNGDIRRAYPLVHVIEGDLLYIRLQFGKIMIIHTFYFGRQRAVDFYNHLIRRFHIARDINGCMRRDYESFLGYRDRVTTRQNRACPASLIWP